MLKNTSEVPYAKECRLHLYQIDDDVIRYDPVYRPLTVGINGVENSMEEKNNQSDSFSRNIQKNSTGWLKRLLIGTMGTGVLAAAGYCCYALGRGSSIWRPSESAALVYPENSLTLADDSGNIALTMQINDQQVAADFARPPGLSRSPYSYYESQRNTESITSEPGVSEAVINDNNYPLDNMFKIELANFCLSSIHGLVIKSNKAKPEYKCELLSEVVEKIYYYKDMYSNLRLINAGREQLAVEEKNNEILTRRKLTTLYLAAETIISGKDTSHFYINAMKDDKNYPSEELITREEKIMNYFSVHQPVGEC
ncbi:hypothetical protein [Klebsiella sp. BIGb0407]|uniref:hypothetical protein n=1 Tax=Klebsiella sp. BIGb0407 TaxID=2940603 RepID=UPI002166C7F3|nr:hypothetical protein [Klebsiella sp. BIGb0407]MCS3434591.1 hypothetical protein [Klebsiella sp. BIGb0407]